MANARAELYQAVKNLIEHVRETTTREIVSSYNDGKLNKENNSIQEVVGAVNRASQKAENDAFYEIEAWAAKHLS